MVELVILIINEVWVSLLIGGTIQGQIGDLTHHIQVLVEDRDLDEGISVHLTDVVLTVIYVVIGYYKRVNLV